MKEAKYWPDNQLTFLTLTYNDENLPNHKNLKKNDFQNFMKSLRYARSTLTPAGRSRPKIKYFHCGEYGRECKTCGESYLYHKQSKSKFKHNSCNNFVEGIGRPHYHAIVFGVEFKDMKFFKKTKAGENIYTSKELSKLWSKGFASIGKVTFSSCAYVSRYIMKKINGNKAKEHYTRIDHDTGEINQILPEYVTMSTKPAIGYQYFIDNYKDIYKNDGLLMLRKNIAFLMKPPRYYDKKLGELNPDKLEEIKQQRIKKATEMDLTEERAIVREKLTIQKMRKITRDYEEHSICY